MSKEKFFVFIVFALFAFVAYRDCFHIIIPADNYSQAYWFKDGFISGCYTSFHEHTPPHLIWFPIFSCFYYWFGLNSVCWITLSMLLHVINAFIVYLIAKKIFQTLFSEKGSIVPIFSALIFLISPYQTEDVLWAPISVRWLFNVLVIYLGVLIFIHHLDKPSLKKNISFAILFLLGIFSNEPALVLPGIYVVLFLLYKKLDKTSVSLKSFLTQTIVPHIVFIGFYFLVSKLWSGHWLWHDGTFTEMSQSYNYPKTVLKYFAKFFLFYRYFASADIDIFLRSVSLNKFLLLALFLLVASAALFLFWKLIKQKNEIGFFLFTVFACFIILLLPVLSIDSSFLKYIYPDRYGYPASAFFYLFFISSIYFLFRKISIPVSLICFGLCWLLLMKTIPVWISANDYCTRVIQNYKPSLKYNRVYVLSMPSYYNGIAAFRSAFKQNIFYAFNKSPVEKIEIISGYYKESFSDSLMSVKKNADTIIVCGAKKRTPFFSTGAGWAKSHETDEYKVDFDSTGCSYRLTFKKEIPQNSAFIYANGVTWKKVD